MMRTCSTTPEQARDLITNELAQGPRTLSELCRFTLAHTAFRKIKDAGKLVDQLVAEGLITRKPEPFGMRQALRMTYRLATKGSNS